MPETNQLLTTILTNTYATKDFAHRVNLLQEFLESFFFQPHEHPNLIFLLNDFFVKKDESRDEFNALNAWSYPFYNQFNAQNLYPLLAHLRQAADNLPVVTLFVPFSPELYEVPRLGKWFRANVGPTVLMEIKTDPRLLGGCALSWKGIYKDFSMRYYLQKSRTAILKVIGEYVTT